MGSCLSQLAAHEEAEAHCRRAIAKQLGRHNAHKNLVVSLDGQGRDAEAVDAYLQAVELMPADRLALGQRA